jgi:hypothetical protein
VDILSQGSGIQCKQVCAHERQLRLQEAVGVLRHGLWLVSIFESEEATEDTAANEAERDPGRFMVCKWSLPLTYGHMHRCSNMLGSPDAEHERF